MLLPDDSVCRKAIQELNGFLDELTKWERHFVSDHVHWDTEKFSPLQKRSIVMMARTYELKSIPNPPEVD